MGAPTDQDKAGHNNTSFDRTRADLFEAIGHPIRIKILEAIAAEPLTFSGLKKRVGIESSGHMTFHLEKLTQLIRTAPDGTYALTDDGREALRLIQTVHGTDISQTAPTIHRNRTLRYRLAGTPKRLLGFAAAIAAFILVGAIAASAFSGVPLYNSQQTLQGSLHYVPSGWSTIQFNDNKGDWIGDFNFNLAGANFGNQSERESILPLDLQIAHLQGTYLKSLQLQFSTGTVCCLDVFFGTQRGYP
jgi:DNA-binding transcriptional ArsR family regulator